jgi:hypothetical protein
MAVVGGIDGRVIYRHTFSQTIFDVVYVSLVNSIWVSDSSGVISIISAKDFKKIHQMFGSCYFILFYYLIRMTKLPITCFCPSIITSYILWGVSEDGSIIF